MPSYLHAFTSLSIYHDRDLYALACLPILRSHHNTWPYFTSKYDSVTSGERKP